MHIFFHLLDFGSDIFLATYVCRQHLQLVTPNNITYCCDISWPGQRPESAERDNIRFYLLESTDIILLRQLYRDWPLCYTICRSATIFNLSMGLTAPNIYNYGRSNRQESY